MGEGGGESEALIKELEGGEGGAGKNDGGVCGNGGYRRCHKKIKRTY